MQEKPRHIPVLLKQVIEGLSLTPGIKVFDGTVGLGGHAQEIAKRIGPTGTLIGFELDKKSITETRQILLKTPAKVILLQKSFRKAKEALAEIGIPFVDRTLLDLGLSSYLLLGSGRGFSFQKDEPLLMTFGEEVSGLTAKEIVNSWKEETLILIFRGFGGEKFAGRIARAIVRQREEKPIETTRELAEIVKKAVPVWYRGKKIHPATKIFQAIRMAVNDEVGVLQDGLKNIWEILATDGRFAVVSFHEVEDRIVKNFFKEKEKAGEGEIITKKPIISNKEEIKINPSSRSSKLRIIAKTKLIKL